MRYVVCSETVQEYEGRRYYRCGSYFQRNGVRLHRLVWETERGAIPDRWQRAPSRRRPRQQRDRQSGVSSSCGAPRRSPRWRKAAAEGRSRWTWRVWPQTRGMEADAGRRWHSEHYEQHLRHIHERQVDAICQQVRARLSVAGDVGDDRKVLPPELQSESAASPSSRGPRRRCIA